VCVCLLFLTFSSYTHLYRLHRRHSRRRPRILLETYSDWNSDVLNGISVSGSNPGRDGPSAACPRQDAEVFCFGCLSATCRTAFPSLNSARPSDPGCSGGSRGFASDELQKQTPDIIFVCYAHYKNTGNDHDETRRDNRRSRFTTIILHEETTPPRMSSDIIKYY